MKSQISRRDFIKLITAMPLFHIAGKLERAGLNENWNATEVTNKSNVIILLFDALTARNISLYGYPRNTMPNLEEFSERATVYHSHHSSCNFTAPSTASFFTGMNPWLHKLYSYNDRIAQKAFETNLTRQLQLGRSYYQLAYTDNPQADSVLHQFGREIDQHIGMGEFAEYNYFLHDKLASRDGGNSLRGLDILMFERTPEKLAGSLVGSFVLDFIGKIREENTRTAREEYPRGLGSFDNRIAFTIAHDLKSVNETLRTLKEQQKPFVSYFHLLFPHKPYAASVEFIDCFKNDGFQPIPKEVHPLIDSPVSAAELDENRRLYDEYIANLDHEFGLLIHELEASGTLENSYLIVTSDHGEMFERGKLAHGTPLLYEPNIHIPLIISKPGQRERTDIYSHTSTVDLLPTLLYITGHPVQDVYEGRILPGFGFSTDDDRIVYSMHASGNSAFRPIQKASFAVLQGEYKLIEYLGYPELQKSFELYNLRNDPEELVDLSSSHETMTIELRAKLKGRLSTVSQQ